MDPTEAGLQAGIDRRTAFGEAGANHGIIAGVAPSAAPPALAWQPAKQQAGGWAQRFHVPPRCVSGFRFRAYRRDQARWLGEQGEAEDHGGTDDFEHGVLLQLRRAAVVARGAPWHQGTRCHGGLTGRVSVSGRSLGLRGKNGSLFVVHNSGY